MKTVLSIAGTDPSGGAGLQADLKTFTALGVYGMGAITAIVAQNTRGVVASEPVSPHMLAAQLESVFTDIPPDAVKIGMIPNRESVRVIANAIKRYKPQHVVIDTVMISSSGFRLLARDAESALVEELFPLAEIVTPNLPEAEAIIGSPVRTKSDMEQAARTILETHGAAVLLKGGHLDGSCDDYFLAPSAERWFTAPRVETKNSHGTGCTLSSAIAANLAKGIEIESAIREAKRYITGAIASGIELGSSNGPIDHCWNISR